MDQTSEGYFAALSSFLSFNSSSEASQNLFSLSLFYFRTSLVE